MYHFYIIYSDKLDRYYIGYTEDILVRLGQHNSGQSGFTSKASDWKLVYTEAYPDRKLAHQRERAVKSKKSRKYLEWLISSAG